MNITIQGRKSLVFFIGSFLLLISFVSVSNTETGKQTEWRMIEDAQKSFDGGEKEEKEKQSETNDNVESSSSYDEDKKTKEPSPDPTDKVNPNPCNGPKPPSWC